MSAPHSPGVRPAVLPVIDRAAATEEAVPFIEEQERARAFGRVEELPEVAFALADVFRDDGGQIDLVEVDVLLRGQQLGGVRLPDTGRAGEQRHEPSTACAIGRDPDAGQPLMMKSDP